MTDGSSYSSWQQQKALKLVLARILRHYCAFEIDLCRRFVFQEKEEKRYIEQERQHGLKRKDERKKGLKSIKKKKKK